MRKAIALDPNLAPARRLLVYLYGLQERRRELMEQFARLVESGPITVDLVLHWCLSRGPIGDPAESRDALARFVRADPEDRHSRLALAEVERRLGKLDEAAETLAPLPATDPDALAIRAQIEFDRGDNTAADRLLAGAPADHPASNRLKARRALAQRDGRTAVDLLERARGPNRTTRTPCSRSPRPSAWWAAPPRRIKSPRTPPPSRPCVHCWWNSPPGRSCAARDLPQARRGMRTGGPGRGGRGVASARHHGRPPGFRLAEGVVPDAIAVLARDRSESGSHARLALKSRGRDPIVIWGGIAFMIRRASGSSTLLVVLILGMSGCGSADSSTDLPGVDPAGRAEPSIASRERVVEFCGHCHAYPPPGSFPRRTGMPRSCAGSISIGNRTSSSTRPRSSRSWRFTSRRPPSGSRRSRGPPTTPAWPSGSTAARSPAPSPTSRPPSHS